jgi:hypothetical protein
MEDFESKYQIDQHIKYYNVFYRLETFGEDRDTALSLAELNNHLVWTAVKKEDTLLLLPGYHVGNQLYHLITTKEWKDRNEFFFI